jgi:hypothetical protein
MNRRTPGLSLASVAAWIILAAGVSPCRADSSPAREYVVKAAFLYNFSQFVQWPGDAFPDANSPFVIGVIGDDPFGGALEQAVRDKKVAAHPIVVEHYRDVSEMKPCHIVYVGASESGNTAEILQKTGGTTLTVGDYDGFTAKGGAFRFLLEENRVRFEVNIDVVKKLRLTISAKLLKLARVYGQ